MPGNKSSYMLHQNSFSYNLTEVKRSFYDVWTWGIRGDKSGCQYLLPPSAVCRNVYSHPLCLWHGCSSPHTHGRVQETNNRILGPFHYDIALPPVVKNSTGYFLGLDDLLCFTLCQFSVVLKTPSSCSLCFSVSGPNNWSLWCVSHTRVMINLAALYKALLSRIPHVLENQEILHNMKGLCLERWWYITVKK